MEITTLFENIEIISLGVGFSVWFLVWFYVGRNWKNKSITRVDIFATIVSIVWIIAMITGLEINLFFNIIGAMSCMHILWEKSAKTLLDFLLQYKWVKK
jgi:hypothetical protein